MTTNDSPFLGTHIQKTKIDAKKISIDFSIWTRDRNTVKHKLAEIFNVTEPKMLTFTDEPDKYYLAIPMNEITMVEENIKRSIGTIEFLVPDGVAHSTVYKKFTDFITEDDKLIFTITNNGNVDALPIITAKHTAENGYIGIVNQTGVIEIGDKETVDSETRKWSERPFDYTENGDGIAKGLADNKTNVAISNSTNQIFDRKLGIQKVWNRDHLTITNSNSDAGNHGASLTIDLPSVGSLYDYIWFRQIFWIGSPNQVGYIKVLVSDTDDKFLYGLETIKRSNGFKAEHNLIVTDGNGGYKMTNWNKEFVANDKETENPFNHTRGWMDIRRLDDKLSLFWWGSRTELQFDELKDKKSAKLHIIMSSFEGKPRPTHMYIDGIKYRKDYVADGYNVPNPYGKGTEIILNNENDTLLIDNIPKLNQIVHGSQFISIPPRESKIEIHTSSWANPKPIFTIEMEERWL